MSENSNVLSFLFETGSYSAVRERERANRIPSVTGMSHHLTKQLSLFFLKTYLLCLFLRLVSRFSPGWACLWGIKGVHHRDQQLSCLCNAV